MNTIAALPVGAPVFPDTSALSILAAAQSGSNPLAPGDSGSPVLWLVILAALAVLPFILVIVTPFAKIVIVGGLLRSALGTPQVPPNTVITGLAMILTLYAMAPVISESVDRSRQCLESASAAGSGGDAPANGGDGSAKGGSKEWTASVADHIPELATHGLEPIYRFLFVNSKPQNLELFDRLAVEIDARAAKGGRSELSAPSESGTADTVSWINDTILGYAKPITPGAKPDLADLQRLLSVIVPAFILTELTEALQIAFLIFVPFVVIDLFVTNLLLAVGMQQMTPTVISLPLKLLVFVMMDGWRLIVQGILLGYSYQLPSLASAASGGGP